MGLYEHQIQLCEHSLQNNDAGENTGTPNKPTNGLEAKRRARYLRFAYPPQEKELKKDRRQAMKVKIVTMLLKYDNQLISTH